MKLTLIKPNIGRMEHSLYVDEARMEPLPLGVLAGLTPPDVEVALYDDRMESISYDEATDLVAITVEAFTARRSYEISAAYRQRGVPVTGSARAPSLPCRITSHQPGGDRSSGERVGRRRSSPVWVDIGYDDALARELLATPAERVRAGQQRLREADRQERQHSHAKQQQQQVTQSAASRGLLHAEFQKPERAELSCRRPLSLQEMDNQRNHNRQTPQQEQRRQKTDDSQEGVHFNRLRLFR